MHKRRVAERAREERSRVAHKAVISSLTVEPTEEGVGSKVSPFEIHESHAVIELGGVMRAQDAEYVIPEKQVTIGYRKYARGLCPEGHSPELSGSEKASTQEKQETHGHQAKKTPAQENVGKRTLGERRQEEG